MLELLQRSTLFGGALPPIPVHRFDGPEVTLHSIRDFRLPSYSLDDAERLLDKTFETEPPIDVRERLVHHLGQTAQLGRLIEGVVTDSDRLEQVADSSEVHPLGFDKIPLLSSTGRYQLRLNMWPDGRLQEWKGGEDRHRHRFDFSSHVKLGRIATWTYDLTNEPPLRYYSELEALNAGDPVELARTMAWHHRQWLRLRNGLSEEHQPKPVDVYQADHQSTQEAMRFLGDSFARLATSHITDAGSTYSLRASTCHTAHTVTPTGPTGTLFLRGHFTDTPDVIAKSRARNAVAQPMPDHADISRPKLRLTPEQIVEKLGTFMDLVLLEKDLR